MDHRRHTPFAQPLIAAAVFVALAAVLLAGCGSSETTTTTVTGSGATTSSGSATISERELVDLFAARCASCHGARAEGGFGPALAGKTGDPEEKITSQITNGGGGMPAFGNQLSAEQIAALVQWIKNGTPGL